jgi:hypothetical protein
MLPTPLIETSELAELEAVVMTIKRSMHWCWEHIKSVKQAGDKLQQTLKHAKDISEQMTYLQIGFLIGYGIIWVLAVRGLGK